MFNYYFMKLKLCRDLSVTKDNLVRGVLFIGDRKKWHILTIETKENLLYLLEAGKYLLRYEYSPKFDCMLWELYGTYPRTEIKFHFGTMADHSRGCILIGNPDLDLLHNTLDNRKEYEIEIINL